jgi:two-component system CheB/CheR fusion protein
MFESAGPGNQIRTWVAACATGEEAYSLAMLLTEQTDALVSPPPVQVFATDLDEQALSRAREGFYTDAEVAAVSEERLLRFFTTERGGFRVRRQLREKVLFAHHNAIRDPPFSNLDMVTCRNLLIYLNRTSQERLLRAFEAGLRPGGFLFLGTSETPDQSDGAFVPVDAKGTAHLYTLRPRADRFPLSTSSAEPTGTVPMSSPILPAAPWGRLLPADVHQRLLERYAPPSLIVTEQHTIIHASERAGRYLYITGGEPSRDVKQLVRMELRPVLRAALHRAFEQKTSVTVNDIVVELDGGPRRVTVSVRPAFPDRDPRHGCFLIVFDESDRDESHLPSAALASRMEGSPEHLKLELAGLGSDLRATISEYEAQADTAKAANEALQVMNEELRAAAEELEVSKEELQSLNEELTTVNQELKIKVEELGLTNNDFHNFVSATDTGTIFLDTALRVKFSTPRAQEVFNLRESDVGRPLSDITSRVRDERLHEDVRQVLETLQTVERAVRWEDDRWQLMRILPYRTSDNRIEGVVLTFQDVTAWRTAEDLVRRSDERLRLMIDAAIDYAIFTLDDDGVIDSWNSGAERMFGYSSAEILGRNVDVLFTPEDRAADVPSLELETARRSMRASDERYHLRKDGSYFYCSGVTVRLAAERPGFAKIARDLTAQRLATEALESARASLEERVRERTRELEKETRQHSLAEHAVVDLLHRLVGAQERERARMALDLHDHLGQQLTALRLTLERIESVQPGTADQASPVREALDLTRTLSQDLDFLAWQLRPSTLDELGLAAALPEFVRRWAASAHIPAECRTSRLLPGQLSNDVELAFYRVAQEALNNVAKHARATRADVVLTSTEQEVVLVVEDDGMGFDASAVSSRGFGLTGMRERARFVGAECEIESTPGKGTSVFLRLALPRPEQPPV